MVRYTSSWYTVCPSDITARDLISLSLYTASDQRLEVRTAWNEDNV